jgi:hypothetical protein
VPDAKIVFELPFKSLPEKSPEKPETASFQDMGAAAGGMVL